MAPLGAAPPDPPSKNKANVTGQAGISMSETGREILQAYGMRAIALVSLPKPTRFVVELTDLGAGSWTQAIYAFLIGEEICRIGSSKGRLETRMRSWSRDLTRRLSDMTAETKMATSAVEAARWRERLERCGPGLVLARPGTVIDTPIGRISAYLDEESVLIGRHCPALNNSKHR